MTELELLRLLGTQDNWKMYSRLIKPQSFSKDTLAIFEGLRVFYTLHPSVSEVDWDAFKLWFVTTKSSSKPATLELFRELITRIKSATMPTVKEEVIKHFITLNYAEQIADTAEAIKKGRASVDDVLTLVHKCQSDIGTKLEVSDVFIKRDMTKAATAYTTGGWEWAIEELNMSVGPLRSKTFVVFSARPEMGKTTFGACNVAEWLVRYHRVMKGPIIWVNNEEDSDDVYNRVIQSIVRMTATDMYHAPAEVEDRLLKLVPNIDKLLFVTRNDTAGDVASLELLFREHKPEAIIIDQLDKVDGFERNDEHVRLGKLYKWAKSMGHELDCRVLALSQASEGAEDKRYFGYQYLRGSKTDKAGEGDVIITMGKEHADPEFDRYFYVCKNKKAGGPKVRPDYRHMRFQALIQPEIASFTSHYTKLKKGHS